MLDRGSFWTPAPEQAVGLAAPGLRVSVVHGLRQLLVSGDPSAINQSLGNAIRSPVGFNDIAVGKSYAAAVARDRMLIVGDRPPAIAEGWNAATGLAATVMDDAWTVLDLQGDALDDLVSMATSIDRAEPTPSSALLFASTPCVAYRHGSASVLRVHVEPSLAPFLLEWIRRVMDNGAAGQA